MRNIFFVEGRLFRTHRYASKLVSPPPSTHHLVFSFDSFDVMIPKRLLKVPRKKRKKTKIQQGQKVGGEGGGGHSGTKSLILAPQDIPDISGHQLGFACHCVIA